MPADFRFIVHTAEGNADELPVHGAGDGAAEGRFADTRWPDKAENRAFHIRREKSSGLLRRSNIRACFAFGVTVILCAPRVEHPHGEMFDNPLFHLL